MSDYITFPPQEQILATLRQVEGERVLHETFCLTLAERLASRTYESAAFAFILMEMLYELETEIEQELADTLPRCIVALTDDESLAQDALRAYREIRDAVAE